MANRDKISDLMKRAAPYLTRMSDDVASDTVAKEIDALVLALESHKASADHDSNAHIWTALNKFLQTVEVNGVLPVVGDTSDIGSATQPFRKGFFSELSTLLFKKENVLVMDGTMVLTKQSGKFEAEVLPEDTEIDFGQAITPGDFLLLRAENKMEYMQVGSLVSGTTYNVTRDLDGSGANNWPAGSVYSVRGNDGDGWLELNAIDRKRFSVWAQGSSWNTSLEIGRYGDITGWQNAPFTGMGIALGDYANGKYLLYTKTDGMIVNGGTIIAGGGNVIIDDIGISIVNPSPGIGAQPFRFIDSNNDQFFSISGASILGRTEGLMILENPPEEPLNSYTEFSIIAKNTLNVASFSRLDLQAFDDGGKIINTNANFIAPNIMVSQNLVVEGTIKDGDDIAYLKSTEKAADSDKLDGKTLAQVMLSIYPVGAIFMSSASTNPGTLFGGTWEAYGTGRVLVGKATSGTFATAGSTGGAETQSHGLSAGFATIASSVDGWIATARKTVSTWTITHKNNATNNATLGTISVGADLGGTTDSGSTLQPYVVVYMWRRTA